jgi:5-methylcytosine-specific restriction endonuclease McrBC regulatory subunit McrC
VASSWVAYVPAIMQSRINHTNHVHPYQSLKLIRKQDSVGSELPVTSNAIHKDDFYKITLTDVASSWVAYVPEIMQSRINRTNHVHPYQFVKLFRKQDFVGWITGNLIFGGSLTFKTRT